MCLVMLQSSRWCYVTVRMVDDLNHRRNDFPIHSTGPEVKNDWMDDSIAITPPSPWHGVAILSWKMVYD